MEVFYQATTLICLIATAVSTLRWPRWWIKGWDIARVHLTALTILLIIIGLIFFSLQEIWVLSLVSLLAFGLIYNLKILSPYSPFHKEELKSTKKSDASISVMAINVRQKNNKYDRMVELVNQIGPDILLMTEVNQAWIDATEDFQNDFPYTVMQPQENTYGIALFSKYPLKHTKVSFLVEKDIPSIHTNVEFKGKLIQFLGLHPHPPAPWTKSEHKDLELIKVAGMTNFNDLPTIVGGDLNDVGWSKITQNFKQISGLLDPRIGRGLFNTYNALIPIFQVPIDHFFVSKHFKLIRIKKLKKIGSDHFPVLLELNLEEDSF